MQAEFFRQRQVDRDVGRRAAGEERGDAALAQAQQGQRVGVAADLPEHDQRVHHQRHEQHAADQHAEQVQIAEQRVQARLRQGGADQAEDTQRGEADHHAHDQGHAVGQVLDHGAGGVVGMAQGHAQADGPGQHADEVGVEQRVDRVVHGAEQQVLQHLADTAGGAQRGVAGAQCQVGREQHARRHGHHRCGEGAQQVQPEDRADVGFLAMAVVGDRSHHQDEHQHRRHGLQGADEDLAEERQVAGHGRGEQGEENAGHQADADLRHQAGAVDEAEDGGHVQRNPVT